MENINTVPVPELSEREKLRAATNSPVLATAHFTLGDREFPILDLEYDDLLTFIGLFDPLAKLLFGTIKAVRGHGGDPTDGLSILTITKYCGKELPEMVRLICKATDPDLTVEDIKRLGKTPFKLAGIVKAQIEQNGLADQIADFFDQILPAMEKHLSR